MARANNFRVGDKQTTLLAPGVRQCSNCKRAFNYFVRKQKSLITQDSEIVSRMFVVSFLKNHSIFLKTVLYL